MIGAFRELLVFIRLFRPHRWWMIVGSLTGLFTLLCGVGLMALSGWFISATASAGLAAATAHLFNFFFPSIGVRLFAFGRTAGRYAERVLTHDTTFRILESLRIWFYERLEPLAPAGLSRFRSADILSRIVADIDALDNLYLRVLFPAGTALAAALLVGGFLALFDPAIALVTLVILFAAGVAVPAAAAKAGGRTGKDLTRQRAGLRVLLVDGLQGMAELLVFGSEGKHQAAVLESHRQLVNLQRRMSHLRGVCSALMTALSGAAVIAVLYIGADRVARGSMAGANLAMVGFAVLACFEAVMSLPGAFQYLGQTREAGRRLLEIVDMSPPVRFLGHSAAIPRGLEVAFVGVCFQYRREGPEVLRNISLRIPHGQRVALLGPAGAGKSTLAHLLTRFEDPSSGRILIGKQDIRKLAEPDLRGLMGVVSQRAHIFSATIRDNLLISRPDAGEGALRAALEAVDLLGFVERLPDGLDTWVGQAGKLLSGGQSRRLAVARAMLKSAPIWILDEPSEGLDTATERALLETILKRASGASVLLITHRPALLEKMDRIVILESGRVAFSGTHASLLAGNRRYADFYSGSCRC